MKLSEKISGLTPCPDKLIDALAEMQTFEINFTKACEECGVIGSELDIQVEGWGFRVRPEACDCEFAGCEHEFVSNLLEEKLNDCFYGLCVKICNVHYEKMGNWDIDDYIENLDHGIIK